MWLAFRTIRLLAKTLVRIAISLEQLSSLYRLDLRSRGVIETDSRIKDEVEVVYGYQEPSEE